MKKNILLTGASGTIGLEVLKQLFAKKELYNIAVFDVKSNKTVKKFEPFSKEITIVYGDISKKDDLISVSADKDVVIHLAAIIPPLADEFPELSYRVNTIGTENLIRLLEENSPNTFFIYSSSISVYGDRLNNPFINVNDKLSPSEGDEYAKTKIKAEEIIRNCNLDWSILRLAAIMGGHKISKLMFHQPLNTSLEIATPEDTATAFLSAINHQKELSKRTFNLGGGDKCRIIYKDFLEKSFKMNGLGKMDFPPHAFADKNFHCGYYEDGDDLNQILNFRKDTMESYFEKEKNKVSPLKKAVTSVVKCFVKRHLLKQSEPLQAFKDKNQESMLHYFNSPDSEKE